MLKYPPLVVQSKTGSERLHQSGSPLPLTVIDFWRWGFSNLIDNTTRGVLAEFLVASALGVTHGTRSAWDSYDLRLPSGITVEVKASAYLQAWGQKELSDAKFGIGPSRAYDEVTNEFAIEVKRQADLYVFCLLKHQDKDTLDPLDVDQWDFFILETSVLNEKCRNQERISLAKLLSLGPQRSTYGVLGATIAAMTV